MQPRSNLRGIATSKNSLDFNDLVDSVKVIPLFVERSVRFMRTQAVVSRLLETVVH